MKSLKTRMESHPVLIFAGLAYIITWLLWAPAITAGRGLLPFRLPPWASLPGSFGPAAAAILLTGLLEGRSGVKHLLGKLLHWRVSWQWYLIALVLPLAFNAVLLALFGRLSGLPAAFHPQALLSLAGLFVFWTVFGGPVGEEPGWRGFALPFLLQKNSPFLASLWVALMWFGWHLPRYLDPNMMGGNSLVVVLLFGLQALVFSLLHTWVYLHTGHSLLMVVLLHGSINTIGYMLPVLYPTAAPADINTYAGPLTLAGLAALLILSAAILLFERSFTRQQPHPLPAAHDFSNLSG